LLCYWQGNHSVSSPEELWRLPGEVEKYRKDLREGRIPFAKFEKLTDEQVKNWLTPN